MSEPYPSKLTANMKKKARSGGLLSIWRNRYFVLENGVIRYYEKVRRRLSIYLSIHLTTHMPLLMITYPYSLGGT